MQDLTVLAAPPNGPSNVLPIGWPSLRVDSILNQWLYKQGLFATVDYVKSMT